MTYESRIKELCQRAKESGCYREGDRKEDGQPYGMTAWAIAAKQLWRMQQDGIDIPELLTAPIYRIFETFKDLYTLRKDEKGNPLPEDLGNFVLKNPS